MQMWQEEIIKERQAEQGDHDPFPFGMAWSLKLSIKVSVACKLYRLVWCRVKPTARYRGLWCHEDNIERKRMSVWL